MSHPTTVRLGVANGEGATKACISTRSGRVPSMPAKTTEPVVFVSRSDKNNSEGLITCSSPLPVISNTPISSDAPKRFLTARNILNW